MWRHSKAFSQRLESQFLGLRHGHPQIAMTWRRGQTYSQELRDQGERHGLSTLEVRTDVHDGYNKLIDEKCGNMVWTSRDKRPASYHLPTG